MKVAKGLYEANVFRVWLIKFPYKSEKYLFFGPKSGAEQVAKKIKWAYTPSIRELKL